ncbi:MAG TPA: hypothetical protein PKD90_19830 [Phnomibacter sp.]|nr:hypothetical protein [Phnomibacter sp.]
MVIINKGSKSFKPPVNGKYPFHWQAAFTQLSSFPFNVAILLVTPFYLPLYALQKAIDFFTLLSISTWVLHQYYVNINTYPARSIMLPIGKWQQVKILTNKATNELPELLNKMQPL